MELKENCKNCLEEIENRFSKCLKCGTQRMESERK